jgi:hypothetical protein
MHSHNASIEWMAMSVIRSVLTLAGLLEFYPKSRNWPSQAQECNTDIRH